MALVMQLLFVSLTYIWPLSLYATRTLRENQTPPQLDERSQGGSD